MREFLLLAFSDWLNSTPPEYVHKKLNATKLMPNESVALDCLTRGGVKLTSFIRGIVSILGIYGKLPHFFLNASQLKYENYEF